MKTNNALPVALQNAEPSKWLEEAKWRQQNRDWLDISLQIALRVYAEMKTKGQSNQWLAEQMGCSEQYVGRLLKGKENLTLQTITKLERILNIKPLNALLNRAS